MQDKILDFLKRKQGYVSGDAISHRLGISRQALWKHMQELKDSGYDIEAVPHTGYRLVSCPDRMFVSEISYRLNTKIIGRKIYYFDTLVSTMDVATEFGLKGAAEGTLVITETQTKGRGRRGREWFSPKYKGIYLSLILRPKILPNQASILTLIIAVSICEAIKEAAGVDTQIKWPNDLSIHNKKIGGILTEMEAETDEVRFINIGLGLNVNNDKRALPQAATSLKEQKKENINRVVLLQEILRKAEGNYTLFQNNGAQEILEKGRRYSITLGKRVKVVCSKEHIEAEAVDIDSDGGLLVRNDAGLMQKIMAGDIIHCG